MQLQKMEFIFSHRLFNSARMLPAFYKRFYWLLLPLFFLQTCTILTITENLSFLLQSISILVCLFLWCLSIDAVHNFHEVKTWSFAKRYKALFKAFLSICLLLIAFAALAYALNLVFSWFLILLQHVGITNKVVRNLLAMAIVGLPFLYVAVNLLMVPYNFIVREDRLLAAVKFSMQLVLPHWFTAVIIYVLFILILLLFGPQAIWLHDYIAKPWVWLLNWLLFSIFYPLLLLLWYDFMIYIQESLRDRLRRAKRKESN